jgi:hypothetical protein
MISLPATLTPTTKITFPLDDGRQVEVQKATPCFKRWHGELPFDTYGGKAVLDHAGEPLFAELVILRQLQGAGWEGVWVDTYSRRFLVAPGTVGVVADNALRRLEAIYDRAGSRHGCFDVLAWNGTDLLFSEAKRGKKDPIRPSQRTWLTAALDLRIPLSSFLVVEWSADEGVVGELCVVGASLRQPANPDERRCNGHNPKKFSVRTRYATLSCAPGEPRGGLGEVRSRPPSAGCSTRSRGSENKGRE